MLGRRLGARRRARTDHGLRPGGRKSPLGISPSQRFVAHPCRGRWSVGRESTSAPPWPVIGLAWHASTAKRAVTCGSAIAAVRRPAIRSGIADGSWSSRSGRPANRSSSPLCLVELNPETGEVISRRQILELTDREKMPSECQASWAGNRLVVLVAGCVLSIDLQGRIAWLRQATTLPAALDPAFAQQRCQPAIESGGWFFVQQPGSCAIDCLAVETGRLRWRRGIIGLQSIADLPGNRLMARTARGLVALSKTTGEVLWQCESPGMLSAFVHTTSGLILGARRRPSAASRNSCFFGIDLATGQMRARGAVPLEKNQPILFGPVTHAAQGRATKHMRPCSSAPRRPRWASKRFVH